MVGVLAVDAPLPARRTPLVLRHEVGREVDVRELALLVEVEARPLQRAVGVRGAVAEADGVAVGLVGVAPGLAVGGEEVRRDPRPGAVRLLARVVCRAPLSSEKKREQEQQLNEATVRAAHMRG